MTRPSVGTADFRGTDRFQVLARLGQGGMGVVYEALDRQRNVRVALKTLKLFTAEGVQRFKNEFRALQDLQHPNLVSLGELISESGQWFFTMELIDGTDFLNWVRPVAGYPTSSTREVQRMVDAPTLPPRDGQAQYEARAREASRPVLDEARLRAALPQLARGLSALHAAGKVHRDIKPSNLLVTPKGRLVLLDFGLATDVGGHPHSETNVVGTADYMAPEQAASKPAGPPADWYSLGVVLYEALTGRLPFDGAPLEVLINKQRAEPSPPRALEPSLPRDLDGLCADLLRIDPAARPDGGAILRRLGAEDPSTELRLHASAHARQAPFVGRNQELAALKEAFEITRTEGKPVSVVVQGVSGVGKTALVRRFTEQLRAEHPNVVVLAGRCYERESVPYKAIDGIVDNLARYMMRLPRERAAQLLPLRIGLLAQVFPVLRRVEVVAQAPHRLPSTGGEGHDPQELRMRVFGALRELFARLAERHPLALVIDDLQWADADSQALISALLHPPEAPPLLLVATARTPESGQPPHPSAWITGEVRHLPVDRLSPREARELATQLLSHVAPGSLSEADVQAIAEEARGHPLFIDELVRHAVAPSGDTEPGARLHLEQALAARIRRLPDPARQLLELVIVAGTPLAEEAALRGAGFDATELSRHLALLRGANLARTTLGDASGAIEPYHDRVRAAVLLYLDPAETRRLHERLAQALEAIGGADPDALCAHWRGAGDPGRAAAYAAQAALQAREALAFDRAARLWRLSLQLRPEGPDTPERQTRLGDSLANLGRGGEAALAYLAAAQHAPGPEAIELQRRAAEQLLTSGHIDEGLSALRLVLGAYDLKLADTPRRALTGLLWRRAQVRLRGLDFRERAATEIPEGDLRRIDVCWSVAIGLGMVDTVRGADFQTRHLLLALRAGEPYRVARALAMEAAFVATPGGSARKRADKLLAAAESLAQRINDPHGLGLSALASSVVTFLNGEWKAAYEHGSRALTILRERCTDVSWEVNTATQFTMLALAMLGQLGELGRRMPTLRREARERGDLYAQMILRSGLLSLQPLAADEPERARQDLAESASQWSQQGFQLQHYWELGAKCAIDLYVGDGQTALDRLVARWPVVERSLMLRIQNIRIEAHHLRARAALATAGRLVPADPERERLLAWAARDAAQIGREDRPWAVALTQGLEAGIAASRGQLAQAASYLDKAARIFDASDMPLHAVVMRRRQGELIGGDAGAQLIATADAWMEAERVKDPRRFCALFAPGFPD